jgi:hypothetical protein
MGVQDFRYGTINIDAEDFESFEKLPKLSFRPAGEIFNSAQALRFLVAEAPRNDKIQRSPPPCLSK